MMNESDFEKALIWNTDRTACFLPEEFSNASIWASTDYCKIIVSLRNKEYVHFHTGSNHLPSEEAAKERLEELLGEIGEKRKQ